MIDHLTELMKISININTLGATVFETIPIECHFKRDKALSSQKIDRIQQAFRLVQSLQRSNMVAHIHIIPESVAEAEGLIQHGPTFSNLISTFDFIRNSRAKRAMITRWQEISQLHVT